MLNLGMIVLCILVAGAVAGAGLNYVNADHVGVLGAQGIASSGRFAIRQALDAYRIANHGALPQPDPDSDFPVADLSPYMPAPPASGYGLTWHYLGDGSGGYYACLAGASVAKPTFEGLVNAESLDESTVVAATCSDDQPNHVYTGSASFKFKIN